MSKKKVLREIVGFDKSHNPAFGDVIYPVTMSDCVLAPNGDDMTTFVNDKVDDAVEAAEESRQETFETNEQERQDQFDNDFGRVKFLADNGVFFAESEKDVEDLDANYLTRLANAEHNIESLSADQTATKELVETVTKQWDITFDTDWTYDYSFTQGNTYRISNLGAGHPNLYLYNKSGVAVQTIDESGVFANNPIVFVANEDAAGIGGYANANTTLKLESMNSAIDVLDRKLMNEFGWRYTYDLSAQADWSKSLNFVNGAMYKVTNNSSSYATLVVLKNSSTGATQRVGPEDGVRPGSVTFFADGNYDLLTGYATGNMSITVEVVEKVYPRLMDCEARLDKNDENVEGLTDISSKCYSEVADKILNKSFSLNKPEDTLILRCSLFANTKYTFSLQNTGLARFYLYGCEDDGTFVDPRDRFISEGAAPVATSGEFVTSRDYSYVYIYYQVASQSANNFSFSINNVLNIRQTVTKLNRTAYGEHKEETMSFNVVDCQTKHLFNVVKGDNVSAQYSLSTDDLRIFALYGCNPDGSFNQNELLAQSEYNSGNSGIISFIATKDYPCIYSYAQRTVQSGSTTLNVILDAREGASGDDALNPDVNVLSYGADRTGENDSTAAIQSAIIDAIAKHKNVYIPYGLYKVSSTINVNTNQPLVIHGFAKDMSGMNYGTVIQATTDMTKMFDIKNNTAQASKIIIRDMMINGNGHVSEAIMYVTNPYVELERVFVINSQGHGILAKDCYYAKFKDILVKGAAKNGLYLLNQANVVRVVDSQISGNASLAGYSNVKIESDRESSTHKNCNVSIVSSDLSSTSYNAAGNSSVEVKDALTVSIRDCYMESSKQCEQNDNYYHIKIDESVDTSTVMNNFIMNGNVRIASEAGAVIGNDFCTQAVYGNEWDGEPYTSRAKKLYVVDAIKDIANYFHTGFSKQVILGEA